MGRFGEKLGEYVVLGLDTSIFIYHLEAHPSYSPLTQELLNGVQAGKWNAITSTVTIMELTVPAWRQGRGGVARQYETLLVNFPNLSVQGVTRGVARRAVQLRARFRVRPADALQVATSLVGGATAFVTNDAILDRVQPMIDIIQLEDYL